MEREGLARASKQPCGPRPASIEAYIPRLVARPQAQLVEESTTSTATALLFHNLLSFFGNDPSVRVALDSTTTNQEEYTSMAQRVNHFSQHLTVACD